MSELQLIPLNGMSEQYSLLSSKLLNILRPEEGKPFIIGVTSCRPGEGVTTIAVRLASSMSERTGGRVLVVDAKLDNIAKSKVLAHSEPAPPAAASPNPSQEADPSRSLQRRTELIRTDNNVDVLMARSSAERRRYQLDPEKFKFLIQNLRQQYGLVIVDCPALSENSFTMRVAGQMDGVVMVVEAGKVRGPALKRATEEMNQMGARILGVVLNKRRYPIPEFIYRML